MKWVRLYHELNHYNKKCRWGQDQANYVLLQDVVFLIDRVFPQKSKLIKFPALINPEFAEADGVFQSFKEHGIDQTGWYTQYGYLLKEREKHFEDVFHLECRKYT